MGENDCYKNLKTNKSLPLLDVEDIKKTQTKIGKVIYKTYNEEKPRKLPSDVITCDVCGNKYTRAHKSQHNKTKIHMAYASMDRKLKDLLLK
jgi:hypothetical protein